MSAAAGMREVANAAFGAGRFAEARDAYTHALGAMACEGAMCAAAAAPGGACFH